MDVQRKRKLIGASVAVVAICGGGAAIAGTQFGASKHVVVTGSFGAAVTPATPSAPVTPGGGLGGGLYNQNGGAGSGRGFGGGGFRGGLGGNLTAAASYLGVTVTALQSDVQAGKTLAQVAKAQGKSVDGLVSAMVDAQKKQFESAVSGGNLSAAQAQQIESFLKQRVTDMVNGTRPSFGGNGGGFGGGDDDGGGFGGPGGSSGGTGAGSFGSAA